MSDIKTELGQRVLARADEDCLPVNHELRSLVMKFEQASTDLYSPHGPADPKAATKSMLGSWTRLKRAWSNYSGDPLI